MHLVGIRCLRKREKEGGRERRVKSNLLTQVSRKVAVEVEEKPQRCKEKRTEGGEIAKH